MRLYLGVDPSLRSPGFALVDEAGVLVASAHHATRELRGAERLASLDDALLQFILPYREWIVRCAIENYSIGSNNRPFDLGEVGGVYRLRLYRMSLDYVEVPPTTMKKFVTGNGSATKESVAIFLDRRFGIQLQQPDEADAAGLALYARGVEPEAPSKKEARGPKTPRIRRTQNI
jgi:crossover junction endodeoxyribonuclease RuvC